MSNPTHAAATPLLPRTLIVLNEAFVQVGGDYHSASVWWRFARCLARHCRATTLYVPLAQRESPGDAFRVESEGWRIVGRPYYRRIQEYYQNLPRWRGLLRRQLAELMSEHDLVICRMPDPVAKPVARAAVAAGRPLALFVGGDVRVGSIATEARSVIVRNVGRLLGGLLRRQEEWVSRRACFVGLWDEQMKPRFAPLCQRVEICQSPTLTAEWLFERSDTCTAPPFRLLRVCQLEPVKGLETLLEAVRRLVAAGRDIRLDVAGGVTRPAYAGELLARIASAGLGERVRLLGNVPFGPELFALYRGADVHVISSKWEGLPRCLAEARASCLPTVATAVGSLPTAIRDGEDGLLVPPEDPAALAAGIARLIDDAGLRRRVVRNGYALAPRSTAEYHAERIARWVAEAMQSAMPSEA